MRAFIANLTCCTWWEASQNSFAVLKLRRRVRRVGTKIRRTQNDEPFHLSEAFNASAESFVAPAMRRRRITRADFISTREQWHFQLHIQEDSLDCSIFNPGNGFDVSESRKSICNSTAPFKRHGMKRRQFVRSWPTLDEQFLLAESFPRSKLQFVQWGLRHGNLRG